MFQHRQAERSFTCENHGWVRVKAALPFPSAGSACGRERSLVCNQVPVDLSALLQAGQRKKGTCHSSWHIADLNSPSERSCSGGQDGCSGGDTMAASEPGDRSTQTVQAVLGATPCCVLSARAIRDSRFVLETLMQQMSLAWEHVGERHCLLCLPRRWCLVLCLHSDDMCSGSCHLLCAQAFLLAGTDAVVPSSGRRAGVLRESPPLCSHPRAPCPFSKGRGSLAAETSLFFFTVSDPIPNIPWRPGASTGSFSLQTVFYLGLRREEKQKRCMSHTKQFTIFIFPVAECCREHTEALSN